MKLLFLLVVIGAIVGAVIHLRRKRTRIVSARVQGSLDGVRAFFARSGYQFAHLRGAPVEQQVAHWQDIYTKSSYAKGSYDLQFVRHVHGVELAWHQVTFVEGRKRVWSESWRITPSPAPRVLFHVSERENLKRTERGWQPSFPTLVSTGDAAFDERFVVYVPEAPLVERATAVLASPPVREALNALTYVDLRVLPDQVVCSDPLDRNLSAIVGELALLAATVDPGGTFLKSLPVHERMAKLLVDVAAAARA
jgi:hypothetical protein